MQLNVKHSWNTKSYGKRGLVIAVVVRFRLMDTVRPDGGAVLSIKCSLFKYVDLHYN